jgi:hypothetical protein
MMKQIIAIKQFEKEAHVSRRTRPSSLFCPARLTHRCFQGDGRILFELMAFGTRVLDADHRSNCLYFMAVIFALSSADPPTEAQRELSISTQDLIKFFRVDGVQHSVADIMSMFVELLEALTLTRQGLVVAALHPFSSFDFCSAEAVASRKAKLKDLLHEAGLPNLQRLLKKARGDGVDDALVSLEQSDVCASLSHELLILQVR